MHLRLIEIENFKGIKSLYLKLNVVTAIFGEGSFGKSTLIEALRRCLAPLPASTLVFSHNDFHISDGGEKAANHLSIRLTFREGTQGEWDGCIDSLAGVAHPWRDGRHAVILEVSATRSSARSEVCVSTKFVDPSGKRVDGGKAEQHLDALRRITPVLVLQQERMRTSEQEEIEKQANGSESQDVSLEGLYSKAFVSPDRLTKEETSTLLEAASSLEANDSRFVGLNQLFATIVNQLSDTDHPSAIRNGSIDHLLSTLGVLALLLKSGGAGVFAEGCQPILAVENLENNLHPTRLASIWDLIAQIPVQKVIITNSDNLLASMPVSALRRMVLTADGIVAHRVHQSTLSNDELRRIGYHLLINRSDSIMSRCWLLVEGESEFWLLPEMAHLLGYDFKAEGIRCVEFAQCGIEPLLKVARDLGIKWHIMVDGDESGKAYARIVRKVIKHNEEAERLTCLQQLNLEHHLFDHGFSSIYSRAAGKRARHSRSSKTIINRAVKRRPKPGLIQTVIKDAQERGSSSVTPLLKQVIETCIRLARSY